jgi:predicted hydrolase (HD superfamily)
LIPFDEALGLVRNTSKYAHAVVVSRIMRKLALKLGENSQEWELVGLLHDLDCDETRDERKMHGIVASDRLKGKLPEACLYAIRAHDYRTGLAPRSKLDKALVAVDSTTFLMDRAGLPYQELSIEMLQRKIDGRSVSQPWLRSNILEIENLGMTLSDFLLLCLDCMRRADG